MLILVFINLRNITIQGIYIKVISFNIYQIFEIIYIYIYIYTNLPINAIVRLPHPWSGDSQGQEMFLPPSADN